MHMHRSASNENGHGVGYVTRRVAGGVGAMSAREMETRSDIEVAVLVLQDDLKLAEVRGLVGEHERLPLAAAW